MFLSGTSKANYQCYPLCFVGIMVPGTLLLESEQEAATQYCCPQPDCSEDPTTKPNNSSESQPVPSQTSHHPVFTVCRSLSISPSLFTSSVGPMWPRYAESNTPRHCLPRALACYQMKGACVCACVLSCFSRLQLFATLWTVACQTPHLWDSPGKSSGLSSHVLLQEIFVTQGLNPGLLHCRQILYHLSYQGSSVKGDLPAFQSTTNCLHF